MTLSPKPGDIVHVRARIIGQCEPNCFVVAIRTTANKEKEIHAAITEILHIEPRPLQVGDMVKWVNFRGKILALNATNSVAWIEAASGEFYSIHVSKLLAIP